MSLMIDGRGMLPPEPLELVLEALPGLEQGTELTVMVYCKPYPLFSALHEAGFVWEEDVGADGTHMVRIRHAVAAT